MQVNCVYGKGSTGRITQEIHKTLQAQGIESIVCYGRGEQTKDAGVYKVCSEIYSKVNHAAALVSGLKYGHCFLSTAKLIRIIKRENPDIVHLQCINGYFVNIYRLVRWLNINGIKTVLTLHADFMFTGNCSSAMDCSNWQDGCLRCPRQKTLEKCLPFGQKHGAHERMRKAFEGFGDRLVVVSVSRWLEERAKKSPILGKAEHQVIGNGINEQIFKPCGENSLRTELGIPEQNRIVLHTTANFNLQPGHVKGAEHVVELAKRFVGKPVTFVVAGRYGEINNLPENIILLGNISSAEKLAACYSDADLTLLTSRQETFSMPCAESLCCGTPVVGFKAGGPETIALHQYSEFVEQGDVNALESCVHRWLDFPNADKGDIAEAAAKTYSNIEMVEKYKAVYRSML